MRDKILNNALVLFFLVGWIVPVAYFGFLNTDPPWIPHFFMQRVNVSRLFFRETPSWWIYELQYRPIHSTGFQIWTEQTCFQMRPFGFRTRFQRLVASSSQCRASLAEWVRKDWDSKNPNNPIAEIRMVRFPDNANRTSQLTGHYVQPTSADFSEKNVSTIADYAFQKN
jgi:hypothetical protein